MLTRSFCIASLLTLSLGAAACAPSDDDGDSSQGAISRTALHERFADLRKVNTDDFARLTTNLGAEGLNNALAVRTKYADLGIDIKETNVFGEDAETNSLLPGDAKVQSLTAIKGGLAQQLGESEFPTELAKIRLDHLSEGKDNYYVETGFGLKGALKFNYNHPSKGFGEVGDLTVHVGFKVGRDVESHLVVATPSSKLGDLMSINGEAIKALRGYVVPGNGVCDRRLCGAVARHRRNAGRVDGASHGRRGCRRRRHQRRPARFPEHRDHGWLRHQLPLR
jgi:hypothetical protein